MANTWIRERFLDEEAVVRFTDQLWNDVRDLVGLAVQDFNEFAPKYESLASVTSRDCTSRANCIRIERIERSVPIPDFIEMFLDEATRTLCTSRKHENQRPNSTICRYGPNGERTGLRFLSLSGEEWSTNDACKAALGSFFLTDKLPFPKLKRQS